MLPVAVAAALSAAAAWSLTPWARSLVESDSRWLRRWIPTTIAGAGGAGAGAISDHWAITAALCALAVGGSVLVVVDLAEFRLPDAIVWPTTGVVAGMLLVAAAVTGDWARLGTALLALLVVGGLYFLLGWFAPQSFGLGDVKLSLVLGLALGWYGWRAVLYGMLAGFTLFALAAFVLLAARRTTMKSDLAFGPWMVFGAAAGVAWGALNA